MDRLYELLEPEHWIEPLLLWGGRLFLGLSVALLGLWIARFVAALVRRGIERRGGDAVVAGFLANIALGAITLIVLVGALDFLGMPTGSLLAALGAAGLGIGLALKDSLGNLAAGVLLIVTRPFRAGDQVEAAGRSGTVQRMGLLQTVLATTDNCEVTLPNSEVMNQPIINFTVRSERRLDIVLSLACDGDPEPLLDLIRQTLAHSAHVLQEPAPQLLVQKLAAGSVELAIRPWVRSTEYWTAHSAVLADLKRALQSAGVVIPDAPRVVRVIPPA